MRFVDDVDVVVQGLFCLYFLELRVLVYEIKREGKRDFVEIFRILSYFLLFNEKFKVY